MKHFLTLFLILSYVLAFSQNTDSVTINRIFANALSNDDLYHNLEHLTNEIGARLGGSPEAQEAVEYTYSLMQNMKLDRVYKQECEVVNWRRDKDETVSLHTKNGKLTFNVCALGMSVATPKDGIAAQVLEVLDFDELKKFGKEKIEGKIVFFNKPADKSLFNPFKAYSGVIRHRIFGASEAARFGAKAVIVRSITTGIDTFPHTGILRYKDDAPKIPAISICTKHAETLSEQLKQEPNALLFVKSESKLLPDVKSHNVIGEIKGSEFPDEIITIGAHLDTWDIDPGAHDDGSGCVQSIDVLRIFLDLGIKPKRTIRAVMFMDEEMFQRGAKAYLAEAKRLNEKHVFAIEADMGGDSPWGFSFDTDDEKFTKLSSFKKHFETYNIHIFKRGSGGIDVKPLKEIGTSVSSLITDWQPYFDYHHCANNTFNTINKRKLQLGAAAMASLVYLIDKYGL